MYLSSYECKLRFYNVKQPKYRKMDTAQPPYRDFAVSYILLHYQLVFLGISVYPVMICSSPVRTASRSAAAAAAFSPMLVR